MNSEHHLNLVLMEQCSASTTIDLPKPLKFPRNRTPQNISHSYISLFLTLAGMPSLGFAAPNNT
jgi:hypothetical protein